jgi:1-acyl-sn-glycerol-3-phosphate acyltransferase
MSHEPWKYRPAADHGLAPAERFRSTRREPGLLSTCAHSAACGLLRGYLRVYHRLAVTGAECLPRRPPFVVIANHASHLDALILSAALPAAVRRFTYPVAAGDVFFQTLPASVLTALFINALPLWRKKVTTHALDDLRERLRQGDTGLILFPEGSRTRDGGLLPFKSGLGRLVTGLAVPVFPCAITGAFKAFPPGRMLPRPAGIGVRVAEPISFETTPNTRDGWDSVAETLRAAVDGLLVGERATRPRV